MLYSSLSIIIRKGLIIAKSDKIIHCSIIGIVTLGGIALLYCGCNDCGLEGDRTAGF